LKVGGAGGTLACHVKQNNQQWLERSQLNQIVKIEPFCNLISLKYLVIYIYYILVEVHGVAREIFLIEF